MADKMKASAPGKGFADKIPEVRRRIADVNERKGKASEWNGQAAKATKDVCDSQNVNKTAFTFVATCHRKEPVEAQDRILTAFALALGTGLLDQIDLFDDRVAFIRAELDKRLNAPAPAAAPGAAKLAALVN